MLFNYTYQSLWRFSNPTTGGFSSLPDGPANEILSLQAYLVLGNSQQPIINSTVVSNLQNFVLNLRDRYNGIYNPQTKASSAIDPLLLQAYADYALASSTPLRTQVSNNMYANLTVDLNYLMTQVNSSIMGSNGTYRVGDPFVLSLTILALNAYNKT